MVNIKRITSLFSVFFLGVAAFAQADNVTLTRQQLIDSALVNNYTYRASTEDSAAANYNYRATWGAFLPTGDLRYSTSNSNGISGNSTSSTYSAEAGINLFNGFRSYSNVRTYKFNYKIATESERETRLRTIRDVSVAYQMALRADYMRKSSSVLFESAEVLLNEAELKLDLGALTRMDLYTAQADREKAYTNLLDAELAYSEAIQEISRLTGVSIANNMVLEDDDRVFDLFTEQEYIETALRYNPALNQACFQERVAKLNKNSAMGTFLPAVNASAGTNWNTGGDNEYNSNTVGLSASWNLFSGFSDMHTVLARSRSLNSARLAKTQKKIDVTHQIQTAQRQVVVNGKKIISSEAYVKAASESYTATQEMFRIGRSSLKDTIDARATLQDAQASLADARYNTVKSYEELNFLVGGSREELQNALTLDCY